MNQIRFPQFAASFCALSIGVALGRLLFVAYGGYIDGTNTLRGGFLPGFYDGFFVTLLPLIALALLSVTVYAAPAALAALAFEVTQDSCYILSAAQFITQTGTGALLPCAFFIGVRAFFAYCYLLLCLRTLSYRTQSCTLPGTLSTVLCRTSRKYYRDFTAVAGVLCAFAFFAHTVFYFS